MHVGHRQTPGPAAALPAADKNCPVHRKPCVNRKEENYFFALSKYQAQLEELCSSPGVAAAQATGTLRAVRGSRALGCCACVLAMPAMVALEGQAWVDCKQRGCNTDQAQRACLLLHAATCLAGCLPTRWAGQRGAGVGKERRARLLHLARGGGVGHPHPP